MERTPEKVDQRALESGLGWGVVGAPKDKVPGRPARTFWTMKDLEHYAQEFGFIRVQREAWGQEESSVVRLVQSILIIHGSYVVSSHHKH